MLWFIITTWLCNLNCIYCGNEPNPYGEPTWISYDLNQLKKFLEYDENRIIAFYGGEPTIASDKIMWIMDNIGALKFVLQTNGTLIKKLEPKYLLKFDTILISIDGRKEITDYYRGRGIYDIVISNTRYLRNIGFSGDLIARMTISGKSDIYLDVKHLIELNLFNHIHWQLDVFFDAPPHRYDDFDLWLRNYIAGIDKLLDLWINKMREGVVLGLVPFQGIIKIIIEGPKGRLPCGAGIDAFAISTSGNIFACPITPSDDFKVGNIWSPRPQDLPNKIRVSSPCTACPYYPICGGRCLYANRTMLWGEKMFFKVCLATRHLIDRLKALLPEIERLVNQEIISWKDILYPPYNNTTEIIP